MNAGATCFGFCLNVVMRKMTTGLAITLLLTVQAGAYDGRWLVVEDIATGTCYRLTQKPGGDNWRRLGSFNTFRQAGQWTWAHRDGVCRHSPVFG
jgi:hypothetical protein